MADHKRVVVLGLTGAGKTTFSRQLAFILGCKHIELDSLFWEANWAQATADIFRERVAESLSGDSWVVDGNYSKVRDLTWGKADTLIWLDYPLLLTLWRLLRRTWRRVVSNELLWNGNRERWKHQFTRDSLFLWALKSYRKQHCQYPILFRQPEYAQLNIIHLHSPKAAREWLENIQPMS